MADSYLHVSVQERDSQQGHREQANAINYLLGATNTIVSVLSEVGILDGAAVEAGNGDIEGWDNGSVFSDRTLITVNAGTGEFTVGADGAYKIETTLVYTGSGNNVQYGLAVRTNGVVGTTFAYNLWSNQTTFQSFTGTGLLSLVAGDVVTLTKSVGNAMSSITGQFILSMVRP